MIFNINVMDNDECMKSPEEMQEIPMIPRKINQIAESVELLDKVIASIGKTLDPIMSVHGGSYSGGTPETPKEMQSHVSEQLENINDRIQLSIKAIRSIENQVEL